MSRIEHMLAAWRPHREAWLANARRLITGKPVGTTSHGLSAKTVISAISAPLACIVAGAALAKHAEAMARAHVERDVAEDLAPSDAHRRAAHGQQHRGQCASRARSTRWIHQSAAANDPAAAHKGMKGVHPPDTRRSSPTSAGG